MTNRINVRNHRPAVPSERYNARQLGSIVEQARTDPRAAVVRMAWLTRPELEHAIGHLTAGQARGIATEARGKYGGVCAAAEDRVLALREQDRQRRLTEAMAPLARSTFTENAPRPSSSGDPVGDAVRAARREAGEPIRDGDEYRAAVTAWSTSGGWSPGTAYNGAMGRWASALGPAMAKLSAKADAAGPATQPDSRVGLDAPDGWV